MKIDIEALKELIAKQGYNVISLSAKSGVDKSTISRLLNEKNSCSVSTAQKIAIALKMTPRVAGNIFFSEQY